MVHLPQSRVHQVRPLTNRTFNPAWWSQNWNIFHGLLRKKTGKDLWFCCPCATKLIYEPFILQSQVFMVWLSFDPFPFSSLQDITAQAPTRWQWPWGHAWWWPLGLRKRTQEMEMPGTTRPRTGTSIHSKSTLDQALKILGRLRGHLFFLAKCLSPTKPPCIFFGGFGWTTLNLPWKLS